MIKVDILLFMICFCLCENGEKLLSGKFITWKDNNEEINPYSYKGWIGYEFNTTYRITKIGWNQTFNNSLEYMLGLFEGSNDKDFKNAVPLHLITDQLESEKMINFTIIVNYAFKYVRYVCPENNQSPKILNWGFYGYESSSNLTLGKEELYQPTSLPLIVINTQEKEDPYSKEEYMNFEMLIINKNKRELKKKGKIKVRGNFTKKLDKKPYKIKFKDEQRILDLPAKAKMWTLIANHYDKTLMRNLLAFKLSSIYEMKYTVDCRYIDLIMNGDFKGNYIICDKIDVGKGRIEITEMQNTDNEEPEISGGYLIEIDGYEKHEENPPTTSNGILYTVHYPERNIISTEQNEYIANKLNELEEEVYQGIIDKIDSTSFIKYFLIEEFTANRDMCWSIYLTKERGDDKFYFGPVWDFDTAFGNNPKLEPLSEKNHFLFQIATSSGTTRIFFYHIFEDGTMLEGVKKFWELSNPDLVEQQLLEFIDTTSEEIKESRKLNFVRWNIMGNTTYEKEIEYINNFIKNRIEQLGEIISSATVESVTTIRLDKDKL